MVLVVLVVVNSSLNENLTGSEGASSDERTAAVVGAGAGVGRAGGSLLLSNRGLRASSSTKKLVDLSDDEMTLMDGIVDAVVAVFVCALVSMLVSSDEMGIMVEEENEPPEYEDADARPPACVDVMDTDVVSLRSLIADEVDAFFTFFLMVTSKWSSASTAPDAAAAAAAAIFDVVVVVVVGVLAVLFADADVVGKSASAIELSVFKRTRVWLLGLVSEADGKRALLAALPVISDEELDSLKPRPRLAVSPWSFLSLRESLLSMLSCGLPSIDAGMTPRPVDDCMEMSESLNDPFRSTIWV